MSQEHEYDLLSEDCVAQEEHSADSNYLEDVEVIWLNYIVSLDAVEERIEDMVAPLKEQDDN